MTDISDAYESAYTIMLNLNRTWIQKQGDFFIESPIIWFLKICQGGKYCTFHMPLSSSTAPTPKSSPSSPPMMSSPTTCPPL